MLCLGDKIVMVGDGTQHGITEGMSGYRELDARLKRHLKTAVKVASSANGKDSKTL